MKIGGEPWRISMKTDSHPIVTILLLPDFGGVTFKDNIVFLNRTAAEMIAVVAAVECVRRFLFQDHDFLRRWEGKIDNTNRCSWLSCNVDNLTPQHCRYLARLMPLIREENTIESGPDLFSKSDYYPKNKAVNEVAHVKPYSAPHEVVEKYQLASFTLEYHRKCRTHSVLKSLTLILGGGDANRGIIDYGIQLCFCFPEYIGCLTRVNNVRTLGNANTSQTVIRKLDIENLNVDVVELTLRDEIARAFAKDVYDQMERPVFIAVSFCDLSKYEDVEAIRDQYRAQLNLNEPLDISEERCLDLDQEKNRNRFALATESRRAVRFTCEGTIIGINTARDWYYKFCSKCIRKVPSRTSTVYFEVALAEADSNRRRKESDEPKDAPTGRDVLNENPSHDELMAVSDIAKPVTTSLARMKLAFWG
ncbi:hypothetical protein Tco_1122462 [Tanacetum coccineum]|uniref:Uncharacterized protein n=1 Tax=Tanacetum coccineum TaxID=301880 RepID=A0ABQ5J2W5_9ASTR